MTLSEQMTTVSGVPVHYWRAGEGNGRALILLHGGYGNAWANWGDIMPTLGQTFDVIAPDLPGWGQSQALPRRSLSALVEWLNGFIDALSLEQAALAGHSFSGLIARLTAAKYPARVPALLLIDGGVIPFLPPVARVIVSAPGIGRLLFRQVARGATRRSSVSRLFHDPDVMTDAFYENVAAHRGALAQLMHLIATSAIPEQRQPQCPVLVMWGEEDGIASTRTAELIQSEIPGAQLSLIAECGHMPHLEVPEVLIAQIEQWLTHFERGPRSEPGPGALRPGRESDVGPVDS
jgi:pimeloyl-ACP methyl ester carboxylesterase